MSVRIAQSTSKTSIDLGTDIAEINTRCAVAEISATFLAAHIDRTGSEEIKVIGIVLGYFVDGREYTTVRGTDEVLQAIDTAIVLAYGLFQFYACPDARSELCWT